ncbi:xylulokinase [Rhodovibrio salinarum]|uniref:Xylulose kinase n=1 Tax=Rhodovibrio salinarum TaxID=1087 RepID=A0A934QG95_9PROT|nr:xylulokinase [Rhodovibrio salinarum]MBK1696411.1 xylulokinase [Rhodovibrio salinarum]
MYLGIDLGTSALKAVLVDVEGRVCGQASRPLEVSRPRPLWSEQDPEAWWQACQGAIADLQARHPEALAAVRGIGLSGQMHGAVLLDARGQPLRPAILWNDGRSGPQCAELERREPEARTITGNLAMAGFTAPKLLWVAEHEPELFAQVVHVLLPKDYLRYRMTGELVSDPSDSAGTYWLDVARRGWSDRMLAATGLSRRHMPELVEGSEPSGRLDADIARQWGLPPVPVAGGGGDNAAAAVGVGAIARGQGFLSLGTSGVLFAASDACQPDPDNGVHTFCHALPDTWHQMAVHLSAASCLTWIAQVTGGDEATLLAEAERASADADRPEGPLFLPYLSGERTPHNDPHAKGVFFGLTPSHDRAALAQAVLEGVAFAIAEGRDALAATGTSFETTQVVGGGARSRYWGRILAAALDLPLTYPLGGELGPAYGAARLGRLAESGEDPAAVCTALPVEETVRPDPALTVRYRARRARFAELYQTLRPLFRQVSD